MTTRRFAARLTLVTLLLCGTLAVPAMAATPPDPAPSKAGYDKMLGNLYDIAHLTLKYAGFIMLMVGIVLWFSAGKSSERATKGVWLFTGGIAMLILHFGFTAIIAVFKWIAQGG
jgi:hypothetical protein